VFLAFGEPTFLFDTPEHIVCLGLDSANTYWFRRMAIRSCWDANMVVRMRDWPELLESGAVRYVRMDFDLCFPKKVNRKNSGGGSNTDCGRGDALCVACKQYRQQT